MRVNNNSDFENFLLTHRKRTNEFLNQYLTRITAHAPKVLLDAMRYLLLSGGKRIRALLVYAVGKSYQADLGGLDAAASAIEMIHSFSLVHDDLPAMDNDSLRRGKPTCHLAFNEATAILVGDALAVAAFQILGETQEISAETKVIMVKVLSKASGPEGMAGGQYLDLHAASSEPALAKLEEIYRLKTAALIRAAVKLGALAANVREERELEYLDQFALNIGLAFQITDDILNIEGDVTKLGKNIGTDSALNKFTYPSLVGLSAAKDQVNFLWQQAQAALQQLKHQSALLKMLASCMMQRDF